MTMASMPLGETDDPTRKEMVKEYDWLDKKPRLDW